nr:tripartite tricarboxylate transporter substrate binding protein [uncultured Roseateles sp.]
MRQIAASAVTALLGAFGTARAQQTVAAAPSAGLSGDIELVVPFPAGGSLDALARVLADDLGRRLGRAVVVINVGGASGAIGAQRVRQRPADGRTLLLGSLVHFALGQGDGRKLADALADFTALGKVSSVDYVVVATPKFGANSLDEWVRSAKAAPGRISLAHPGYGTLQYLTALEIERRAGIELLHVPYSGSGPMLADLASGQVDVALIAVTAARPLVDNGRVKLLGILRTDRHPTLPAWPVSGESASLSGVTTNAWAGLFMPAGAPQALVQRLRIALADSLRNPALRSAIVQLGSFPADPGAVADGLGFPAFVESELQRLADLQQASSAHRPRR